MKQVKKGVPLPPKKAREKSYPELFTMAISDCFIRPIGEYKTLHSASQHCRRTTKRKFAMRKLDEKKVGIWRTA